MSPSPNPTFSLIAYFVEKVVFGNRPPANREPGEAMPPSVNYGLHLNVGAGVDPSSLRGQTTLTVRVDPDQKWQPYEIEVAVTGQFQGINATAEQMEAFCKTNGPVILFPYIREIVHKLTIDGAHGPIRLHPINVPAVLGDSPWETVKRPSDSEPPSEQSPSASPESKT